MSGRTITQNPSFAIEGPTDEDKVEKMCRGLNRYRQRHVPGPLLDFTK